MKSSWEKRATLEFALALVLLVLQWLAGRPARDPKEIYLRTVPGGAHILMPEAGSIHGVRVKEVGRSPGPIQVSLSERSRFVFELRLFAYSTQVVELSQEELTSPHTVVYLEPAYPVIPALMYWLRDHLLGVAAGLVLLHLLLRVYLPARRDLKEQELLWKDGRLKPGLKFDGYVLGEILGQGGAGVTYRAWPEGSPENVYALKALSESKSRKKLLRELKREWQACSTLNHASIMRLVDWGEVGNTVYVVSELIEGKSLEGVGRSPAADVCEWGLQLVDALRYAHLQGVVHRDLKPANLLLTDSNRVKLLDFGIAASLGEEVEGTQGTPGFMPPEQVNGQVDPANDYYSLGVTLYTLLSGEPPFTGDTVYSILNLQQSKSFRPLNETRPELSSEFSQLLEALLEPIPEKRLADPDQVERLLKACRASLTS